MGGKLAVALQESQHRLLTRTGRNNWCWPKRDDMVVWKRQRGRGGGDAQEDGAVAERRHEGAGVADTDAGWGAAVLKTFELWTERG